MMIPEEEAPWREEYRLNLRNSSEELERFCSDNRENLKMKAIQTLEGRGCQVYLVSNAEEAATQIAEIVQTDTVVTYPNTLFEELGLLEKLRVRGIRIIRTDVLGFARDKGLGDCVQDKMKDARLVIRQEIASAPFGLTGVQAVVANHGSLMLMDEQGSVHSVSSLPYTHIAVASVQQIVPDLTDAMTVARQLSLGGTERVLSRYISLITGPSSTSDIEGQNVRGMHGPKEVKVILMEGC
jgi:L-lactate dehydrogenase complex protein LldG